MSAVTARVARFNSVINPVFDERLRSEAGIELQVHPMPVSQALADADSPRAYRCATLAGDIAMRTGDFPKAAIYFQVVLQELGKRPRANAPAIANLKAKLGEVRA